MPPMISARSVQAGIAILYVLVAGVAVLRCADVGTAAVAGAMIMLSYLMGRSIPPLSIPREKIILVCGMPIVLLSAGVIADAIGGSDALRWAAIVMAYCAGNRFRAAGFGPAG